VTVSEPLVSKCRMDNELEGVFMEVVVAEFGYCPCRCLDDLRKTVKDIVTRMTIARQRLSKHIPEVSCQQYVCICMYV
jgi:hypothetical protein